MKVIINGREKEFSQEASLQKVIEECAAQRKGVIAEVNGQIVKCVHWPETSIKEGDTIELVNFVGGG